MDRNVPNERKSGVKELVWKWSRRGAIWVFFLLAIVGLMGCPRPAKRPVGGGEPTISLFVNETGQTKKIRMDEYVQGVVAAEMDPSWPGNALAAQAILARTYTLKKIADGGVKAHGTDASTSVEEFQAYDPGKINDPVREAVAKTSGLVVNYQGKPINAWFFADSGGKTAASAVEGLDFHKEPAPYVHSVQDPGYEITTPENKSWTSSFPWSEVNQAVRKVAGKDPGASKTASIAEKGPSGRATRLKIGEAAVSGPAFRLALGSEKMRSTQLTSVTVKGSNLVVSGKGFGHGVGMSQWGARALAEQGKNPQDIINYFFQGVNIVKKW